MKPLASFRRLITNMKHSSQFLILVLLFCLDHASGQLQEGHMITRTDYLVYTPEGYANDTLRQWPVLYFLHGAWAGGDAEKLRQVVVPRMLEEGKKLPFIVVAPLGIKERSWQVNILDELYEHINEVYRVDPERVYVLGISLGASGAWDWAYVSPQKFAAIAPVAGPCIELEKAWRVRSIPTWIFQGSGDVSKERSQQCISTLKRYNNSVHYTYYEDLDHMSIINEACQSEELFQWFSDLEKSILLPIDLNSETLKMYAGNYILDPEKKNGDTVQLFHEANYLYIQQGEKLIFYPESEVDFHLKDNPLFGLSFIKSNDKVTGFILHDADGDSRAAKID